MNRLSSIAVVLSSFVLVAPFGVAAAADPYPSKIVRMIVPYSAGGTGDNIGRAVGAKMSETLGQNIIIDNKPGAGGNIGAEATVRSPPDGYTIVMAATSLASNPSLQRKMPYDPVKDLIAIAECCEVPMVLVVHPSLPIKTIKEFIAYAKAHPGKLNFASSGIGTTSHLAGELFKVLTGVDITHVPYKADAQALPDLLAGQVNTMFMFQTSALPHVKTGKLRAVAVSTTKRSAMFPDLPTIAEGGVKDYEISGWFGLFAPAGTPKEIVNKLADAAIKAVESPALKERLQEQGAVPSTKGPEQFAAFFKGEVQKWAKVVKAGGVAPLE
jgi:tripartite-type tricarboxylate transporter receptor subunit TctC